MTDDRLLYQSSIVRGSYFNRMLGCGPYDRWVEIALGYLPRDVLDEHKEDLAFISMAHRDGCRLSRVLCETREIILLSDHVLPKGRTDEGQPDVRYFIYVVLHEVAHAIRKHKSPQYDSLNPTGIRGPRGRSQRPRFSVVQRSHFLTRKSVPSCNNARRNYASASQEPGCHEGVAPLSRANLALTCRLLAAAI